MSNESNLAFPIDALSPWHKGLTKREYFAAMAMQGFIANSQTLDELAHHGLDPNEACAKVAIMQADALIAELEKQP